MSAPVDVVSFDHPRVTQGKEVIDAMVDSLAPYVVVAAISPNFHAGATAASPTLQRAFDVGKLNLTLPLNGKNGVHPPTKTLMPNGYALKIDGTMRIDSKARLDHVFGGWNQTLGTSVYPVQSMPDNLRKADDAQFAKINADIKDKLAKIISPTHRVTLEHTSHSLDGDKYALFVTANDVPAARQLYQHTAARAASGDALTLEALANSDEYAKLHERSQCARDTLAKNYADALGVNLAADANTGAVQPSLTSLHYTITQSNSLAHGNHKSSVPQSAAREPRFFVVYNDASPAHDSNGAGVVVSHGIMGGHTVLNTAEGQAWQQPKFLSLIPATSGLKFDGHMQAAAQHRTQTERSQCGFRSRVVWHSDLGDEFPHAHADETYYSMHDPYTLRWLERLSSPHGGPLTQLVYGTLAGQLPSVTTLYAAPEELLQMSQLEETPANVAVALDNVVVSRITVRWDTLIRPSGYKLDLASVFANVYEDSDDNGFRMLSHPTMCTNPAHAHSMRIEAVEHKHTHKHAVAVSNDFQARSVITIDKHLLRLITLDVSEAGEAGVGAALAAVAEEEEE